MGDDSLKHAPALIIFPIVYPMSQAANKILKTQGHFATDLVTLDFKSDSLQKFLQHVVSIVNQHSYKINQLEFDKLDRIEALSGHQVLTNAISINHPSVAKSIVPKKQLTSTSEDNYAERNQILANKLDYYNQAIEFLCRTQEEKDKRLSALEKKQGDLVLNDNLRDRLKGVENDSKRLVEDECGRIQGRMKELQNRVNKKLGDFQNLTQNVQKNTLWKITQCEEGLSKRITPEYVDKALEQFEGKILRQVKNNLNSEANDLKFKLEDLIKSCQRDQQKQDDAFQNLNKMIKQLQEMSKHFHNQDEADTKHRELQSRIKQTSYRIQKLQRQGDPKEVELKLTKDISEVREKAEDAMKRLKVMQEYVESINNVMSSVGGADGSNDPHKLCYIDGEVKRLKDANRTNQSKLAILEEELKTKLLIFEERISASLAMMRNQENNVSRQELYESVNRLREPINQRFSDTQNLINEIVGKVQKLQTTQKAIRKKIKQMTKGDDLTKILDQKQNLSEAKLINDALNQKIESLEILFEKMKMQMDYNSSFVKEMQEKLGGVEEGFSIISNKQRIFPAKCLTCGIKHVPQHNRSEMQGSDGKFYRVDLRNNCVYDQEEVFDVVPSQISLVQTTKKDGRISSAKGRGPQFPATTTNSYYSGYRPHSAKKS